MQLYQLLKNFGAHIIMRTNMKKSKNTYVNTRWTIRRDFPNIVAINNQSLPEITEDDLIKIHRNAQKPISLIAEIKEDIAEGKKLGIKGTPTFIINGNLIVGARGFEFFDAVIEKELR